MSTKKKNRIVDVDFVKKMKIYVKTPKNCIKAILSFPSRKKVVICSSETIVEVLCTKTGKCLNVLKLSYGKINDLKKMDANSFVCGCEGYKIVFFRFSANDVEVERKIDTESSVQAVLKVEESEILGFLEKKIIQVSNALYSRENKSIEIGFWYDGFDLVLSKPIISKVRSECLFVAMYILDEEEETYEEYKSYCIGYLNFVENIWMKQFFCCEDSRNFRFTTFLDSESREILIYFSLGNENVEFYDVSSSTHVKNVANLGSGDLLCVMNKYLLVGKLGTFSVLNLLDYEEEKIDGSFEAHGSNVFMCVAELEKFSLGIFVRNNIGELRQYRVSGFSVLLDLRSCGMEEDDCRERIKYVIENLYETAGEWFSGKFLVKLGNLEIDVTWMKSLLCSN